MSKDFPYLISLIFTLIILSFFFAKWYKRDKDKITFLNKKAFIISVFIFMLVFFCFLSMEKNDSIVITIIVSLMAFWLCYAFLWGFIFNDPKYPDGNDSFEAGVLLVLEVQKNNYNVPFPYTVGMYERIKHNVEQYMIKHGIANVSMGEGLEIYYEFESPEAKAKYFKNVQNPTPEDSHF